jgi:hypothetical protein
MDLAVEIRTCLETNAKVRQWKLPKPKPLLILVGDCAVGIRLPKKKFLKPLNFLQNGERERAF